jgi:hypothetical protein
MARVNSILTRYTGMEERSRIQGPEMI